MIAATMPGFGNPFDLDLDTFMKLRRRAILIGKIAACQADDRDVTELEAIDDD